MRWPWQDVNPKDGEIDDYPFDTWKEIFLAWIALVLTGLLVLGIIGYVSG